LIPTSQNIGTSGNKELKFKKLIELNMNFNKNSINILQLSLDEVIRYDIPATIEYILRKTEQKDIYYVGHSLGCVVFWGATNIYPELNDKVC